MGRRCWALRSELLVVRVEQIGVGAGVELAAQVLFRPGDRQGGDMAAQLLARARDFLVDNAPVSQLRELRDSRDPQGFAQKLWHQFAEMGFTGVLVPDALGGLGLGHVEAGVVMEQIGHALAASPFLASSIVSVCALRRSASAVQQQNWLPRLASGEAIATLALDETSKHRPDEIELRATPTACTRA